MLYKILIVIVVDYFITRHFVGFYQPYPRCTLPLFVILVDANLKISESLAKSSKRHCDECFQYFCSSETELYVAEKGLNFNTMSFSGTLARVSKPLY